MKNRELVFTIWSVLVILFSYIVPYTFLYDVRDLSLYFFWLFLAVAQLGASYIYLSRR